MQDRLRPLHEILQEIANSVTTATEHGVYGNILHEGNVVLRKPHPNRISSFLVVGAAGLILCVSAAQGQDTSFGRRLFHDKADCQFCHGVNGDGHGDPRSPGKATDLHKTSLTRDQLVEVIACGRPGSEMPHFDKYAYEDKSCYGMSAQDVGKNMPPDPHSTTLTRREIEAVADYVLGQFAGK